MMLQYDFAQHSRPAGILFTATAFSLSVGVIFGAFLLAALTSQGNGELALTPSPLSLCPGEQLHLTCNSSSELFYWTVYDTNNDVNYSRPAAASSSGEIARQNPIQVGSFTFNIFSQVVNNTANSLTSQSLISNITVDSVDITLNGTVIVCAEFKDAIGIQDMVTLNVIDSNEFTDFSPQVNISEPVFGTSNVTVDITIQQDEHSNLSSFVSALVMYLVTTFEADSEEYVQEVDKFTFEVTVPYNVHVQVNITIVTTLCGQSIGEMLFSIPFNYTNCGHPVILNSMYAIEENTIPVTEGSILNFSCPPELILAGPNATTCMKNGEWEPDLGQARCIAAKTSQVVAIVASVIGTMLFFITLLTTIIIFTLKKRKVLHCRMKKKSTSEDVQLGHPTQEHVDIVEEDTSAGYRTLVYADLGPGLSSKQPRPLATFDDYRMEYATINYKLTSEASEATNSTIKMNEHPADKLLNLDTLLMQLQGQVTPQWYQFGEALGVEEEELEKSAELPSDQSIIEVLDYWIRNHTGPPTWKEVANALSQLNLHKLSLEIERIYAEGKLVVENEAHSIPTECDATNLSKQEAPPIPAKYSTVSYAYDCGPQECIQHSTGASGVPDIPPKLPPKAYTHQASADFEEAVAPARPPKPKRL